MICHQSTPQGATFGCSLLTSDEPGLFLITTSNHASSVSTTSLSTLQTIPKHGNFTYCPESRKTDLYDIDEIEAVPGPPIV
jgi:hypothetical protein